MRTLLFLLLAPGCVFITDTELASRIDKGEGGDAGVDPNDDTGVPNPDDCEEADKLTFWSDADGDGYGDATNVVRDCEQPAGTVTNSADCNDNDPSVTEARPYYTDGDSDGFGDPAAEVVSCEPPPGAVEAAGDCDDADTDVNPEALETCATVYDDNCDGLTDGEGVAECQPWYEDTDGDGFGEGEPLCRCAPTPGFEAPTDGDCDDTVATTFPGAAEVCNDGQDNDCDGSPNACELSGAYALAAADGVLRGEANLDWAGWAAAAAGDQSGDGAPDLLLAAHKSNQGFTDAGAVYLLTGGDLGTVDLDELSHRIVHGDSANSQLGYAISGGVDLTGDGALDLVLGAPTRANGAIRPGAVWVVPGPLLGVGASDVSDLGQVWTGLSNGDLAGCAVAAVGDVDGDGLGEVLAGAYKSSSAAGVAYLQYGPILAGGSLASADLVLSGATAADRLGYALADAGDMDGDGLHEVLVSADRDDPIGNDAGTVYILSTPGAGSLSVADISDVLVGAELLAWAGFAVAGGGDLNGDGFDDVLVGAPGEDDEAGAAYLVHGPVVGSTSLSASAARIAGLVADDRVGRSLSIVGDVNADGALDFLLGAQGDGETMTGSAALFYGPVAGGLSLSDADALFSGASAGDASGYALAGADVNLDGATDLLITSPRADGQAADAGSAALKLGGGQ